MGTAPTDAPKGEKPTLLVYGNCQAGAVGAILGADPALAEAYGVHYLPSFDDRVSGSRDLAPEVIARTALLLILGSSPMVESIPAFFAASRYGAALVVTMSLAFAASTIATYVVLSVYSASSLQRVNLGPIERYGEVLSGVFIAAIGVVFGAASVV